jgi:predicted MFS family arabinose efflux permease
MAITFGIWQDAYQQQQVIKGPKSVTGIIGTTTNGVMYLSMPFLSTAIQHGRSAERRRAVALAGTCLACVSFFISSWSSEVWHFVALQGLLAALGNAMLYVPTTLWLDEWFRDSNRATAYGIQFSIKNAIGTSCPFLMQAMLEHLDFRTALRVWSGIAILTSLVGLAIIPNPLPEARRRQQCVAWSILKHRTFYVYAIANVCFSSGYGLPQTYLPSYASQMVHLSPTISSLTIVMFNAPSILSSTGFGIPSDRAKVYGTTNMLISALGSAICVFLFWSIRSNTVPALLITFSLGYGFFASGYSSTWGGWIKDFEKEAGIITRLSVRVCCTGS